ncbi:MAG TPA: ubiquinone/menaquinone biosynthesis methyltransferase [Verrucomicrobiales bacterium]|nr:ubiquinone/menaquinone biosynthesis methyltransferase [Verrucomicrobiales bacterium]
MQDPAFVKRAFAGVADRYVCTNHVLSLGLDILWRKRLVRLVADAAPQTVLDLATGSGDVLSALERIYPEARGIGVDFCPEMLVHARRRGLSNLLVADALCLPFAPGCVDAVTVAFGLRNMESWPKALSEMNRVLRPGGRLFLLDFSLPTAPLFRRPYAFYLHWLLPRIAGLLTGKREAYAYLAESIDPFPSGAAMRALLMESGFHSVQIQPLTFGVACLYTAETPGAPAPAEDLGAPAGRAAR